MIYITSKPIIDAITKDCPYEIKGDLQQIVFLSGSKNQTARFETSVGEQNFLCHYWINVITGTTELYWRFITPDLSSKLNSIKL